MKRYNLYWLKEQNVIGKVVSINDKGEEGFWCGKCGELNRHYDYDSHDQKCSFCDCINEMQEL